MENYVLERVFLCVCVCIRVCTMIYSFRHFKTLYYLCVSPTISCGCVYVVLKVEQGKGKKDNWEENEQTMGKRV